jgi:hypothetical protein
MRFDQEAFTSSFSSSWHTCESVFDSPRGASSVALEAAGVRLFRYSLRTREEKQDDAWADQVEITDADLKPTSLSLMPTHARESGTKKEIVYLGRGSERLTSPRQTVTRRGD